jgi:hypothetical protein
MTKAKRNRRRCGVAGINGRKRGNWVVAGGRRGQRLRGNLGGELIPKQPRRSHSAGVSSRTTGGSFPGPAASFPLTLAWLRHLQSIPIAAGSTSGVPADLSSTEGWIHVGSCARPPFRKLVFLAWGTNRCKAMAVPDHEADSRSRMQVIAKQ